jgi:hypothetical protein
MGLRYVLIASVMAGQLAACQQQPQRTKEPDRVEAEAQDAPALPIAEAPLDRRALLSALAEVASAVALGQDDRERQRELDGKRFELRLRFGCGGPGEPALSEPRRWTYEEDSRVLRLHVGPDVDLATPLVRSIAAEGFEAAEGFWVRRPWLLSAGCPARPQASAPEAAPAPVATAEAIGSEPAQPEPRIAIAQFYTAADPRTHRRDSRAYQATKTLDADEAPSASGYDLVLSGRLKALPGGRVIACTSAAAEAPPACIISAAFDQVAIEAPDGKESIAQWATG